MRAILSVEFSKKDMCDQKTVDKLYGGSWLKLIKYLYAEDGMRIFLHDPKIIRLEQK